METHRDPGERRAEERRLRRSRDVRARWRLFLVSAALLGLGSATLPAAAETGTTGTITTFAVTQPPGIMPGIGVGPDGALWFPVHGAATAVFGRITTEGTLTEYPVPAARREIHDVVTGADGNLWYTEMVGNAIGRMRFDSDTHQVVLQNGTPVVDRFPLPTGTPGWGTSNQPMAITAGPDGAIWFLENRTNKVGRLDPAAAVPGTSAGITEIATPTPGLGGYNAITTGPDDALWFTKPNARQIGRIPTDATGSADITEYSVPNDPDGIATGPDGNLWFTETWSQSNAIGRMTTAGQVTEFPLPPSPSSNYGGRKGALMITAGPGHGQGKKEPALWFAELSGGTTGQGGIGRITTDGTYTDFTIPLEPGQPFAGAQDITLGPDANLWFTERVGRHVGRVFVAGNCGHDNCP